MKVVSVAQMRQLEQQADAAGVSYAQMMDAAGRAVAEAVAQVAQTRFGQVSLRIVVLVGPGNNGGDGLVAARYLHDKGYHVALYLWNRQTSHDALFALIQQRNVQVVSVADDPDLGALRSLLAQCQIVVDALLGIGVNRPIEGTLKAILQQIAAARANRLCVVAVDLPSGVNADSGAADAATVSADVTVTFAYPKIGFYKFPAADTLGELRVVDIGIPAALAAKLKLNVATSAFVRELLPARPRDGHKGTFGKALIVAGAATYTGAPYLSAAAAARSGLGIATLATIAAVQQVVAPALHEPTYLLLAAEKGAIAARAAQQVFDVLDGYQSLLVGPGLGRAATTQKFVERLFNAKRGAIKLPPTVIDADGLNALSVWRTWSQHVPPRSVLTPHVGEFGRLTGLSGAEIAANREALASEWAARWGQIVLLKGAYTCIADPDGQVTLLPFANPALATAGSGDVLAGIIVGLMAQGAKAHAAAIAGGYVHGLCGERVRDAMGDAGALAGDLLPHIPQALRQIRYGA